MIVGVFEKPIGELLFGNLFGSISITNAMTVIVKDIVISEQVRSSDRLPRVFTAQLFNFIHRRADAIGNWDHALFGVSQSGLDMAIEHELFGVSHEGRYWRDINPRRFSFNDHLNARRKKLFLSHEFSGRRDDLRVLADASIPEIMLVHRARPIHVHAFKRALNASAAKGWLNAEVYLHAYQTMMLLGALKCALRACLIRSRRWTQAALLRKGLLPSRRCWLQQMLIDIGWYSESAGSFDLCSVSSLEFDSDLAGLLTDGSTQNFEDAIQS